MADDGWNSGEEAAAVQTKPFSNSYNNATRTTGYANQSNGDWADGDLSTTRVFTRGRANRNNRGDGFQDLDDRPPGRGGRGGRGRGGGGRGSGRGRFGGRGDNGFPDSAGENQPWGDSSGDGNWRQNRGEDRGPRKFNRRDDRRGGAPGGPYRRRQDEESVSTEVSNGSQGFDKGSSWDDSWGEAPPDDNTWRGDDRGSRRPNRRDDRRGGRMQDEESVNIEVPSSMVGKIIGRGGSKISELQTESGARINVTKEENDGSTVVKLSGSAESIEKAKALIDGIVNVQPYDNRANQSATNGNETYRKPLPMDINWQELSEECDRISREKWAKCPPLKKTFYQEHPTVTNLSAQEVEKFREEHNNIVVSRVFADKAGYKEIPNPVQTFHQAFEQWPDILEEIRKMGFENPSPIQSQAWPVLLSGEDLIGIAQTGTGKTLAFLLPALIHIEGQPVPRGQRGGPNVLVMAPTRELALQIEKEVKKYNYKNIKAVCLYGGGNRREQVNTVTAGVEIVIATPGRLNDLVQAGYIDVSTITYLVLDEADRMLDMGFEPQIRKVLLDIRPDRQTVMTSATWPPGVRRLAESYMDNPVQVYVGSLDLAAVHSVTQIVLILPDDEDEKFRTFLNWINTMEPDDKVIVFCGKKARADYIATELISMGINCQSIHGDREQQDREQALVDIADGHVQILIATDVASRGIDIQDITHVINYDFPRNVEEYVHRVGRTGRAGKTGESISYFTRADWGSAKELIAILEEAQQYVPEELYSMSERYGAWRARKDQDRGGRGGGRFGGGGGGRRW